MVDNIQIDDYFVVKIYYRHCYYSITRRLVLLLFLLSQFITMIIYIKEKKKNVRECTKMIASLSLLSQFGVLGTVVTKLVTK